MKLNFKRKGSVITKNTILTSVLLGAALLAGTFVAEAGTPLTTENPAPGVYTLSKTDWSNCPTEEQPSHGGIGKILDFSGEGQSNTTLTYDTSKGVVYFKNGNTTELTVPVKKDGSGQYQTTKEGITATYIISSPAGSPTFIVRGKATLPGHTECDNKTTFTLQ